LKSAYKTNDAQLQPDMTPPTSPATPVVHGAYKAIKCTNLDEILHHFWGAKKLKMHQS